ncbi:hypothetical protein OSB04_005360 [Centaurea solstitialis]|uniref:Uncharacterized protein n=1 Tax=Centaurea solstitialis TaxID=347529 RepID=A0AA38TSI0_9ASTR|nr:hypothetical protein OSB04_005360 [Centaurea solstitialis]
MAEFVSVIFGTVVECLVAPVTKQLGYLFLSGKHVKNLGDGMKRLEGASADVENHKDRNKREDLEVPARVPGWLEEVAEIKTDADKITSSNGNTGCFNVKARYQMGRNAWKTAQEIERFLQEGLAFGWTDAQKPLGRVYTRRASMSSGGGGGDSIGEDFKSRDRTFNDALELLQQDQKTRVIALCGMGGVGKTTMMEQLRKTAGEKKMFDWIVKVVIGKQPNWHSIQQTVAENLGSSLKEESDTTRAERLGKRFEVTLKQSEKGILVILDDVWEKVELKDVGLSPLPNGVKLLLTSRNENFCKVIAVHEGNLKLEVLQVGVLEHEEAHNFLCKITNISKESDPDLYKIGGDIVKKCSCLPLAIKIIAPTLISEDKSIWEATLRCLRSNDPDLNVQESIRISYDNLKDEDKEIFLLCGLFPEDADIPVEDLIRYAWGLKLLKRVSTFRDGKYRIIRCVNNLKKANLLIDGTYHQGCVKLHDLVLSFVLATVETGDRASIINHGDSAKWNGEDMSDCWKRISLTCRGMCEFPEGFEFPNISLLKLMHGDDSFKFPQGFYENTKKLQVIAYEEMQYPLLPRSLQCSHNLQMLCLHGCSLMFDISFIGDLSNLEVLNITKCKLLKLPSTIGKLKKLKVLDLTGCSGILIDDGVLKGLVSLEELYLTSFPLPIKLTDANFDELVGCSKHLTALEIEFTALPKNTSLKKLERFKISLGCKLDEILYGDAYMSENTLKLVSDKCEILDSMNELFDKTAVLYLQVNGVNDHGDALAESLLRYRSSFYNLRFLTIRGCQNLRYLFTVPVANGLMKLEGLTVSSCSVLETVVDGVGVIKFQALKFLSLENLPKLKSLCNTVNINDLGDGLAEKSLHHDHGSSFCNLRDLSVYRCADLRYLFTVPMANGLTKLERLTVSSCPALETVVQCNKGGVGVIKFQALEFLSLNSLPNLCNTFGIIELPQLLELQLGALPQFTSIYPLATSSLSSNSSERQSFLNEEAVISNLEKLHIHGMKNLKEIWPCQGSSKKVSVCMLREFTVSECNSLVNLFPSNPMLLPHHLEKLYVRSCASIEVLFNIDLGCAGNIKETRCCLRSIKAQYSKNLREVWRIEGAKHNGLAFSGFQAIESIEIQGCKRFRNVFTPTTTNFDMKALTNLKIDYTVMWRERSQGQEEIDVMSNEEISKVDDDTICNIRFSSSLIHISHYVHTSLTMDDHKGHVLEIEIQSPSSGELTTTPQNNQQTLLLLRKDFNPEDMECMSHVWKCNWNKFFTPHRQQPARSSFSFHNLTTISLYRGKNIKYLFSPLVAKLLSNLKKIHIQFVPLFEEVVSNRDDEDEELVASTSTNTSIRLFPYLEQLYLKNLPNLKRIGGGSSSAKKGGSKEISSTTSNHDQSKPIPAADLRHKQVSSNLTPSFLDDCPLASLRSWVQSLHYAIFDWYLHLANAYGARSLGTYLEDTVLGLIPTDCGRPGQRVARDALMELYQVNDASWSLCQYCTKIVINDCEALPYVIPSYALRKMQKLENLEIRWCESLVEVFETQGFNTNGCDTDTTNFDEESGDNDDTMVAQRMKKISMPQLSNLKEFIIQDCDLLHHVFTFSTLESLTQLEKLRISSCKTMEVIVKVDNGEQATKSSKVVVFPRLKSITLYNLPNLKGFFLGKNIEFQWPLLDDVRIDGCPQMMMFTSGCSMTPKLKYIYTDLGKHSTECGLNFRVMAATLHESPFTSLDTTNSCATTSERIPWSFHNLIEMVINSKKDVKKVFPSNELLQLQKLEKILVTSCHAVELEEIFEALEGVDNSELQSLVVVKIPNLREMVLSYIRNLKYIHKSSMVLEFPNLTKVVIIGCMKLEYVFSSSMADSLSQLQALHIWNCDNMEVIVKGATAIVEEDGEECDDKMNEIIMLPRLEYLRLEDLPSVKGFYLGKGAFSWTSLDTLEIKRCRAMSVFTRGDLLTPKLRVMDTTFGRCELLKEKNLSAFINTKLKEVCDEKEKEIEEEIYLKLEQRRASSQGHALVFNLRDYMLYVE